jgi:SAM-dependent methyltransferase
MLGAVFAGVPQAAFECALELGAGDGYLSTLLARHTRLLVSTEIRRGRLVAPPPPGTRYTICDAETLPFGSAKFDFVFSSHLLEHLPDLCGALGEMRRTLRDDGVMVHLVPTRAWKLLDLALFYPSQVIHLIEKAAESPGRRVGGIAKTAVERSTVKQPAPGWWRRSLWPPVHGVAQSNRAELVRFGVRHWAAEFERAGLDVVHVHRRLPFHSPYRFGLERTRRLLESLGASSTVAFVLTQRSRRPAAAELFAVPRARR